MIARISGEIVEIGLTSVTVDSGSLAYAVRVSPSIASSVSIGERIQLFTALVVREDSWTLFGFSDGNSRDLFEELQTVTGIGPKVAHSLLAAHESNTLRELIGNGEQDELEKVPGIGKKVASRIILELKDKYGSVRSNEVYQSKWRSSLLEALISLGYSNKEAERAIEQTLKNLSRTPSEYELSELLKLTLGNTRSGR